MSSLLQKLQYEALHSDRYLNTLLLQSEVSRGNRNRLTLQLRHLMRKMG